MTNPIKIVVLSSYNALVEEFMYRGVYLAALTHTTALDTTWVSMIGPGIGVALSVGWCAHLDVHTKFMNQETSEPWKLQPLDIGIALMAILGSFAIAGVVAAYDTRNLITVHNGFGIFLQAFVFAEGHRVGGLPQGKQGFVMLLAWASGLGVMRLLSGGLGLILLAHIVGDSTLGFIILWISQQKKKQNTA